MSGVSMNTCTVCLWVIYNVQCMSGWELHICTLASCSQNKYIHRPHTDTKDWLYTKEGQHATCTGEHKCYQYQSTHVHIHTVRGQTEKSYRQLQSLPQSLLHVHACTTTYIVYLPILTQNEMFKVVHLLLRCSDTRKKTLDFLEQMLAFNAKKAQLVTDRHSCSSDGLLLNLLHILQQLCSKVKLSSVDPLYLCQTDSRVSIEQETRLACSLKKLEQWRKETGEPVCLSKSNGGWTAVTPKVLAFVTRCLKKA